MNSKKKIGIMGGMGSRAGILFLNKIIEYSPANTDQEFPEIIFHNNSSTPDRTKAIVDNCPSPLNHILKSIDLFNQNKVDIIAIACITSYFYFYKFCDHTTIKIINPISIVDDYLREKHSDKLRIGILATTGTISSGLFHKSLKNYAREIITLLPKDQEELFMRSIYMKNGYKSSKISEDAKKLMHQSIEKLINLKVDIIIAGCTEVSVAVDPEKIAIPYIDTLDLFAKKIVEYCYY